MTKEYTKEEIESISKSVNIMIKTIVEDYPDLTNEIVELKKILVQCETAEDAIAIITKILELQLDYMNEHPEFYPKYNNEV